jgi:O-antigen ligase
MGQLALNGAPLERKWLAAQSQDWIFLILTVGGMIVFADGLTRPEMLVDAPVDTFTYQAVWGAWVFGLVMLPICLSYAKHLGTSLGEGVLLWFILGMVTFAKEFSYLRWPGAPIFITDVVLLGFLVRLFVWPRQFRIRLRSLSAKLLLLYLAVGLFTLARSILAGHALLLTMRDFSIAFYSLFAFVGFAVIRSWAAVRRAFLFFLLGAILSCIDALAWFWHQPGARRYLSPGDYVLAAFLGMLIVASRKIIKPAIGYSLAGLLVIGVILSNARTLYVELAVMLLLVAYLGSRSRPKLRKIRLKAAIGMLAVVVGAAAILEQTRVGSAFIDRSLEQLVSGTIDYQNDPDAVFRLAAWGETLSLTAQHPLFGIGYGVVIDPFTFMLAKNGPGSDALYSVDVDTRPHNTYLTVLYQMGLVGFLALVALLLRFFSTCWRTLRRFKDNSLSIWLYLALIAQLTMVFFGGFNLFLETPFCASIFWLTLGIGWRIQQLLKAAHTPTAIARQPSPASGM